ncbi:MAG: hypothetical protein ACYDB9_12435 [Gammaproteobacteria bacterium]
MHRVINIKHDYRTQGIGVEPQPLAGSFAKPSDPSQEWPPRTRRWLAPRLDYLPVQMQQTEPGKATITLVLTETKLDTSSK